MNALPPHMSLRHVEADDHSKIIAVQPAWWGGRDLTSMLPRLFVDHFGNTSWIIQQDADLVAFLIGFLSPARVGEGYIHFAGVHPEFRRRGLAAYLYRRFFALCRHHGGHIVRACTSPVNRASVAFHRRLGFAISPGTAHVDGIPVTPDYNRPGDPKVRFEIAI